MSLQYSESGAADEVGGILMTAILAFGVGIAAVAIFSSPIPHSAPSFEVSVTNTTDTISLTHTGGDPLRPGEFRILVEGQDLISGGGFTKDNTVISDWSSCSWSLGQTIRFKATAGELPKGFCIVYTGDGSPRVIRQIYR